MKHSNPKGKEEATTRTAHNVVAVLRLLHDQRGRWIDHVPDLRFLAGGRCLYTHFHPSVEIVDLDHISSDAPNGI